MVQPDFSDLTLTIGCQKCATACKIARLKIVAAWYYNMVVKNKQKQ